MNNLLGCNEIGNFSKSDPRSFYSVVTYSFYFKYYLEESCWGFIIAFTEFSTDTYIFYSIHTLLEHAWAHHFTMRSIAKKF